MTTTLKRPLMQTFSDRARRSSLKLAESLREPVEECIRGTAIQGSQYALEFMVDYTRPSEFRVTIQKQERLSCVQGEPMGFNDKDINGLKMDFRRSKRLVTDAVIEGNINAAINIIKEHYEKIWDQLQEDRSGMARFCIFFSNFRASGGRIIYDFPLQK